MSRTVAILGLTGSVGSQALDVVQKRGYRVDLITANRDARGADAAARKLMPDYVAMADEDAARELSSLLSDTNIKVLSGADGICEGISLSKSETVINSIIGEAGLMPTLAAIDANKRVALANKETLVIAGDIVMSRARERGVEILPVDSEHSAIFQSMLSGKRSEVKRLLLTASGGPFYGKSKAELSLVTLEDTLRHPTWKMGRKITVDSATLMNKGFEIIEAAHLFGITSDKIEVVVHRESIMHSAVEYIDNTVIAQLSVPDMRSCVQYALDYPCRMPAVIDELDLFKLGSLTFMRPDTEAFPLLSLAKRAFSLGGAMGAVLNAADEIAVQAFLDGKLSFLGINEVVIETFDKLESRRYESSLDAFIAADRDARKIAEELIDSFKGETD